MSSRWEAVATCRRSENPGLLARNTQADRSWSRKVQQEFVQTDHGERVEMTICPQFLQETLPFFRLIRGDHLTEREDGARPVMDTVFVILEIRAYDR